MELIQQIFQSTLTGDQNELESRTIEALERGIEPTAIVDQGYIPAMEKVGDLFSNGEYYLPEMLKAARAVKVGLEILKPHLTHSNAKAKAKVMICTVKGDLHDIGKNLVGMMMEGNGLEVIDLGIDVAPEKVLEQVSNHKPDVLALSALLTTTMESMESVVKHLVEAGIRDRVKVLVGGAPINQAFADSIGADGYGADASQAVRLAKSFFG